MPANPFIPPARVAAALSHTAFALSELRRTDDTLALSSGVALIWIKHLGPKERALMLASAIKAATPRDAVYLRQFLNSILDETEVPPLEG